MSEQQRKEIGSAKASPTKAFFVRMLTRDIELQDAILDLLDNCLDGILRTGLNEDDPAKPFAGYRAKVEMCGTHFVIEDNCGGIPFDTAVKYAFAMGRPSDMPDDVPSTIGMYGIGMKRAIFKLGTEALVESSNDKPFVVEFSPDWMASDEWSNLPIYDLDSGELEEHATRITVFELNDEAKANLSNSDWVDDFRRTVARHYSIIISKGFEVVVGSREEIEAGQKPIEAEPFKLLQTRDPEGGDGAIRPYVYAGTVDGVEVEVYAGLYRKLLTSDELDREEETRGSTDEAGWTVACNDRVVIWKDKTKLTGWGEASVPNYHGQFIPITGIVLMHSEDPRRLPLTTTKRGIDAASNVYLTVKDLMREATKSLTSFTNKWKRFPEQRDDLYRSSAYVSLPDLREMRATLPMSRLRKVSSIEKFEPTYPTPRQERTGARISFVAEKDDIALLASHYFDTTEVRNEAVGKRAFDEAVQSARRGTE